jgi:Uma2 family endonuclease
MSRDAVRLSVLTDLMREGDDRAPGERLGYTSPMPPATVAASSTTRMTYTEYIAAEADAECKHEYLRGEVWAMAGGSAEHGALTAAVIALLGNALRDKPCRIFTSDVRVRVQATDLTTYPDVSVVCGHLELAPEDGNAIINPVLLVEVLSDSTEAYDRGEKAAHYRRIPSLREYLLISQHAQRLELFRRTHDDRWELSEAGPGQPLELSSVDAVLKTDDIYRNPLDARDNPSGGPEGPKHRD